MNRHHTGSGRRAVIPADWATHHQPVVEKTMLDATVTLRDPAAVTGPAGWNDATEQVTKTTAGPYWTGGARIQVLNQQGRQPVAADDPETAAGYLVVVPAAVGSVLEGHLVKVTKSDDPLLTDRTMRVVMVARGSHRWERDLFCELTD